MSRSKPARVPRPPLTALALTGWCAAPRAPSCRCWYYQDCGLYQPFLNAKKPVWNIEYAGTNTNFLTKTCPKAIALGIQSIK